MSAIAKDTIAEDMRDADLRVFSDLIGRRVDHPLHAGCRTAAGGSVDLRWISL